VRLATGTGENLYRGLLDLPDRGYVIPAIVAITVLMSALSMSLRQLRHLEEVPGDILRMPLFVLFSTLFLMPLRAYGFLRLGHVGGWGTRAAAYSGDEPTGPTGPTDTASSTPNPLPANPTGDPRALLPYLAAALLVPLGVMFDAQLF
jgi:hyaluronan synthase